MKYICHRVNTAEELERIPERYGVELDIRDGLDGRIYIQHNPFEAGEDFEEYLKRYHHGMMIVNVKSERVELKAMELLKKYGIEKYFFLDSSFPMIKLLADMGEYRQALRYSEYEGMDTIRNMAGKAEWIWVDCFTRMPLTKCDYQEMKSLGYQLCFVSPELQGQGEKLEEYKRQLEEKGIELDAVCTKMYNIERWNQKDE
ncbi:MAG: hypothetical protein J5988_12340 [Eubacterium sp.]|nr:hypothetical protein [Eubacterium sp.]